MHFVSEKILFLPPENGEMAERSIAAVLKTVEGNTSGGSNPSLSANFVETFQETSLRLFKATQSPKIPIFATQKNPLWSSCSTNPTAC